MILKLEICHRTARGLYHHLDQMSHEKQRDSANVPELHQGASRELKSDVGDSGPRVLVNRMDPVTGNGIGSC